MDNIVGGRCLVSLINQLRRCIFSKNKNIFRHLKQEIALAIPASNDEKYNLNNSAGHGLTSAFVQIHCGFVHCLARTRSYSTLILTLCRSIIIDNTLYIVQFTVSS